jgi:nucleotide-binding universal stress UspA family protein
MKKILAPIDFSSATAHVLDAAAALAADLDAEITLFHSIQPPTVTSDYGLAMENVQEIVAVTEKTAQRQLEHSLRMLSDRGIKAHSESAAGAAITAIVSKAREIDAAYIVMGSHGHTALYDLLVGSTTHGVLKDSPCPVVIVPPHKDS